MPGSNPHSGITVWRGPDAMWRETNLLGIYISPLIVYMLTAAAVYAPLRLILVRLRAFRVVWNPPLAEVGLYTCILGGLVAWF